MREGTGSEKAAAGRERHAADEERRFFVRYECSSSAVCELALRSGPFLFGVENISEGGLHIKSPDATALEHFPEGGAVRVISCGDGEERPDEDLTGRVVWSRVEGGLVRLGIEFDAPLASKLDYLLAVLLRSESRQAV